jgi:hypothetical protein
MHHALSVTAAGTANYNPAIAIVYVDVLTATQQVARLDQVVLALVPTALNAGQANALTSKLDLKGNGGDRGKVTAFINQVNAFRKSGTLTAAQADALTAWAEVLLVTLATGS